MEGDPAAALSEEEKKQKEKEEEEERVKLSERRLKLEIWKMKRTRLLDCTLKVTCKGLNWY